MPSFSNFGDLIAAVIDHAFQLHSGMGPGLLESAYETFLAASLREAGLHVAQHHSVSASYRGTTVENAFRIDLLVERKLIAEIKSVERVAPVFGKQVLTYLRLTGLPVGLLINFGSPTYEAPYGASSTADTHTKVVYEARCLCRHCPFGCLG